jgi:hypothetical protein
MQGTGILYLSKAAPVVSTAADGSFVLTLMAVDRIGPHQVEPWCLTFTGLQAKLFWAVHQATLQPGQPLRVTWHGLRVFMRGVKNTALIFAYAERIELAPRAPSAPPPCRP